MQTGQGFAVVIKETGDIFDGNGRIKTWILEGAAVHTSIIGFDDGIRYRALIWTARPVDAINSEPDRLGVDLTRRSSGWRS